jgi:orotate phosphoribosyltransferase
MPHTEQKLRSLLTDRSFRRGTFDLASGATSSSYIDVRTSSVSSRGAHLIGQVIYEHTKDLAFDAIGGLEVGAIPLITAAVIAFGLRDLHKEGFWVRDKVKDHGTKKLIEGNLKPGSRVVIVDDVITSGGSSLKAIEAVREIGCEVVLVLALVDRLQGARELFHANGIESYESIFMIRDLGVESQESTPRPHRTT